jgi:pimeloyl-ACP methyl ester carboxylesterase
LGLYGFSVGSTAAALVAADDPRMCAVALGAIWPSIRDELAYKFRWSHGRSATVAGWIFRLGGTDVDAIRPVDVVGKISPQPLLLLSGSRDVDTPSAVVDRLFQRAPGAERWVVERAGHGQYVQADPDGFDRRVGGFFDRALLTDVSSAATARP